jgi:hypothetical protein
MNTSKTIAGLIGPTLVAMAQTQVFRIMWKRLRAAGKNGPFSSLGWS